MKDTLKKFRLVKVLLEQEAEFRGTFSFVESVRTRHVILGHLLVGLNYKSESGCTYCEKCRFRHVEADGQPSTKSKKSGVKGSGASLEESTPLGCVSQDSHPRNSILRKEGQIGIKSHRRTLQGFVAPRENSGKKGPSQGVMQKCEPHECNPCAPIIEHRTQDETLHQERSARRAAWESAKNVYKLKINDKATLYSPIEARETTAPTSKSPEEREFVDDSGAC